MGQGMGTPSAVQRQNYLGREAGCAKSVRVSRVGPGPRSTRSPQSRMPKFRSAQPTRSHPSTTQRRTSLSRDELRRERATDRDPHGIFRTPTDVPTPPTAALLGPLGSSSFWQPAVEAALEGIGTDVALGNLSLGRRAGAPTSSITRVPARNMI